MTKTLVTLLLTTFLLAEENNISIEQNSSLQNDNITVEVVEVPTPLGANLTIVEEVVVPTPKVYAILGDIIYNNAPKIEKLKELEKYAKHIAKIDDYMADVERTKEMGFAIQNGSKTINKGDYLKKIRSLAKRNDAFTGEAISLYKASITYKDSDFFSKIINSGLLDTTSLKDEIMRYYLEHTNDVEREGVIQGFLYEDEHLQKEADSVGPNKAQLQAAKIKRIRQNNKNRETQVEQELEDELTQKKAQIRRVQEEANGQ